MFGVEDLRIRRALKRPVSLGTSGDPRSVATQSEGMKRNLQKMCKMDLTGADIPDDEILEEPNVEELKSSRRNTQCGEVGNHFIHKNLVHLSKELSCRAW